MAKALAVHLRRNLVAYLALLVALGGSGYASSGKLLARNSVGSAQVVDHSLQKADLSARAVSALHGTQGVAGPQGTQGPAGARGVKGATGAKGVTGVRGVTGPAGSPDSPSQVLAKVEQVDGSFSGLDADRLDGRDASEFVSGAAQAGGTIVRRFRVMPDDGTFHNLVNQTGDPDLGSILFKCPTTLGADGQIELFTDRPLDLWFDSGLDNPTHYIFATSQTFTWNWNHLGDSQTFDIVSGAISPAGIWTVRVQEDNFTSGTDGCHALVESWASRSD